MRHAATAPLSPPSLRKVLRYASTPAVALKLGRGRWGMGPEPRGGKSPVVLNAGAHGRLPSRPLPGDRHGL